MTLAWVLISLGGDNNAYTQQGSPFSLFSLGNLSEWGKYGPDYGMLGICSSLDNVELYLKPSPVSGNRKVPKPR